jgi:hypothetical protein
MPAHLTPNEIKNKYAYRRDVSRKWTCFDLRKFGTALNDEIMDVQKKNQVDFLTMLKGLILGKCTPSVV